MTTPEPITVVFTRRDPLGRCPTPGCVYRWRDGADRPCWEHVAEQLTRAVYTSEPQP